MKAIIVVTYPDSPWIKECIASLQKTKYPVMLCINPVGESAYDPAAFYYAQEHNIHEFIIIHDTMIIKDVSLFDEAFKHKGNIAIAPEFFMCLGKYESNHLPPLPKKPVDKSSAINFESNYCRRLPTNVTICPEFRDSDDFIEIKGQKRMVLENKYLIKYKGCWNPEMVKG